MDIDDSIASAILIDVYGSNGFGEVIMDGSSVIEMRMDPARCVALGGFRGGRCLSFFFLVSKEKED